MSLHPRRRGVGFHAAAVAWLTAVWVLLWGGPSVGDVLAGALLAVLVVRALPMPAIDYRGRVRPLGVLRLVARFAVELVVASTEVALLAASPWRKVRPAVVRVRLLSRSDLYVTLTAQLVSLVPGTVVVEAHRSTSTLYVHVLDVDQAGGVEAARAHVLAVERRVLAALASDAELAECGALPGAPGGTAAAPAVGREVTG